jgi:hypothetical protein
MTLVPPSAADAATKYSKYLAAARFQLSALSRDFFPECKEVKDKRLTHC